MTTQNPINQREELLRLTKEELVDKILGDKERQKIEVDTLASLNVLETIHQAQTDFITVDSEVNIFHKMLSNFIAVTQSEYGFIDEMFITDNGEMYLEARSITNIAWDNDSRVLYDKLVSGQIIFNNLNSLYGEVMKTGQPYFSNDASNDPKRTGIPQGHPTLNKFLGIPLHAGGQYVGMLGLANAANGYSEAMIQRLEPLTKICSIILLSYKTEQKKKAAIKKQIEITKALEL